MRWNAVHASQKVLDLLGKEGVQAVLDTIDHDKVKCHLDKPGMVIPVLHKRSGSSLILIIEVETRIALLQTSEQYESFLAYLAEQEKTGGPTDDDTLPPHLRDVLRLFTYGFEKDLGKKVQFVLK